MPKVKGIQNYIQQTIYDRATVATSATTQLTMFQVPVGQSSKTLRDTNMRLNGQISVHHMAKIRAINLLPVLVAAHTYADLSTILNGGWLAIEIMSKNFLELPLLSIPAGSGVTGMTTGNAAVVLNNGWPIRANKYFLDYPIVLNPGESFNVTLNWSSAPTPGTAMDFYVLLDAWLKRPVL